MLAPSDYRLKRLDPASPAFAALVRASREEGYWMLVRLADSWAAGHERFARRGEALLAAWRGDTLAGVCGLGVDPHAEGERRGRLRHLYVAAPHRRAGVGRKLVWALIDRARRHFPVLALRAPDSASGFYESLGFERVTDDPFVTHRMRLAKAPPRRGARR